MTNEEAGKIYKAWQEYIEINDKMSKIFYRIPESFLPYPTSILEQALNIIAKQYFDIGNIKMMKNIQETMATLIIYTNDEDAIENLIPDFYNKTEIKGLHLKNLKVCRDSWAEFKK